MRARAYVLTCKDCGRIHRFGYVSSDYLEYQIDVTGWEWTIDAGDQGAGLCHSCRQANQEVIRLEHLAEGF